MPLANYSGKLADIGLAALPQSQRPVMRVRPEEEAFSSDGLISEIPKSITVDAATGIFYMSLVPSGEMTASSSGRSGVDYIIEVGRFEETIDGYQFHGADFWKFTAVAGGGNVGEMKGGSLLAVWVGPPWPPLPSPRGLYVDRTPPNDWGVRN